MPLAVGLHCCITYAGRANAYFTIPQWPSPPPPSGISMY